MSNKVTNPISVNQIVDTNLDLKCITLPECRNYSNDLQALIDDYCSNKFDKDAISTRCLNLPANFNINSLLNELVKVSCTNSTGGGTGNTGNIDLDTIFLNNINFCDSDNWTIISPSCLTLVDNCNNPITQYNVEDVFRALIRRIISLQNLIKTLNTTVTNQTSQINTHTAEIANIVANCCNITLVSQIQTLNARLAAAGIP